jgi:hypothetical protein
MNIVLSLCFVILFCVDYYSVYYSTKKIKKDLTEKQLAYILSIKVSCTILFLSLYFNYKFIKTNFNIDEYISQLTSNDFLLLQLSILNLVSYFITDCVIGFKEYHTYMMPLSGYMHHIVYAITCIFLLTNSYETSSLFFIFCIEELPTIFLSSGQYNPVLRKDLLFGTTFFITRIVYHAFLTWKFKDNNILLIGGILSLCIHCYWFYNWFTKYGVSSKKLTEAPVANAAVCNAINTINAKTINAKVDKKTINKKTINKKSN